MMNDGYDDDGNMCIADICLIHSSSVHGDGLRDDVSRDVRMELMEILEKESVMSRGGHGGGNPGEGVFRDEHHDDNGSSEEDENMFHGHGQDLDKDGARKSTLGELDKESDIII